jgi:hypothetical protein
MFLKIKNMEKFRGGSNKRDDWVDRPTWFEEVQACALSAG